MNEVTLLEYEDEVFEITKLIEDLGKLKNEGVNYIRIEHGCDYEWISYVKIIEVCQE